jgi:hypothetical protein
MTLAEMGLTAVVTVMGGGNVWGWLSSRGKTKVDLIQLAQSIAAETIKALDLRIAQMEATIEDQGMKIEELTEHIGKLEDVIVGLGGNPPLRPRRKIAA